MALRLRDILVCALFTLLCLAQRLRYPARRLCATTVAHRYFTLRKDAKTETNSRTKPPARRNTLPMTEAIRTYTVPQVARLLNVCRRTIYYMLKSGELKRIKVRARTMIRESDLTRFLDRGGRA